MKFAPLTRTTARWTAGLLVAAGLAIGIGIQPAAADEEVGAPTLQSLRLEAPDAYVTFTDNSAIESDFRVIVRERNNPDRIVVETDVPPVPGEGRVVTRSVSGITAGVALCATVHAQVREENPLNPRDNPIVIPVVGRAASNTVCADPASPPPDLALEKISGREEREWTLVKDQAPAYLVNLRNDGAGANGVVVVDIATSGVARLAEQPAVVRQGWEAAGFTCAARPPAGAETAALRCTGGSLAQGARANPAIAVQFTGRGYGYIHATVSVSGGPAELNTSGNSEVLGIRIY
ncbi:MAG: hypothetical protein ACRDJE_15395 [Dehalococcoidia bacterium]